MPVHRLFPQGRPSRAPLYQVLLIAGFLGAATAALAQDLAVSFTEVGSLAGARVVHAHADDPSNPFRLIAGGAAAGDVDGDGWPDLYVIGGDGGRQHLLINQRDGSFTDRAFAADVAFPGDNLSAPALADIDGNRTLDLFIGTVGFAVSDRPRLLLNDGHGRFRVLSDPAFRFPPGPYTNATFGDFDGDGLLDLFTAHWVMPTDFFNLDHLWRNHGEGRYVATAATTPLPIAIDDLLGADATMTFTANFADIDNDGWPDILVASDYGQSQVFRNLAGLGFEEITTDAISDENGMGAAVADFDNDGYLDWFVTAIYDPLGGFPTRWGDSGNRLYRNRGDGTFDDVTHAAGVRDGAWGWGTCAADFDNDGWLDIFHVNGWATLEIDRWTGTPARLFMNNRDGTFTEHAAPAGVDDRGEGLGVICFDYDRDGDIDIFVANNNGPSRLFRNDLDGRANFIQIKLVGIPPNTEAIGARVHVRTAGMPSQMRELRAGSNFVSQDPAVAHFGLADATVVEELEIAWPHRTGRTVIHDVGVNRHLVVYQVAGDASCDGSTSAADLTAVLSALLRGPRAAPCPGGDMNYDGAVDREDLGFVVARVFAPEPVESFAAKPR